ncbi:MAG: acetyl/propionyl/methylcrotonyl-CoA carboxylase subunit alpha [Actinomycetota bacterium]
MGFDKVLVANRGAIASRVFRAAREAGYGTVAVYTDDDAGFPFVRDADQAVRLTGRLVSETYLDAHQLIEAAERSGADAIHPGYGFLSESADFARTVEAAGLVWIGPRPETIELMGSKIEAKRLAEKAGVPTLGWGVTDMTQSDGLAELARDIGYPLLAKASAGGGGRGIRRVDDPSELLAVVESASREAQSSFGDGSLLLERLVDAPRHIEVQVVADNHGAVAHLFERECSVQRRFQKVVEECPSPSIGWDVRNAMCEAAVALAGAVGYRNVGTVEYVVDRDDNFYFLEMNTRLQVEHGVTEEATGLDLVRLQLDIASGRDLPDAVANATLQRSAIQVRIYAENPAEGFRPAPGKVERFDAPSGPGIRVESAIESGVTISPLYDSMLAKVIAVGEDREEARRRLDRALGTSVLDVAASNVDFLRAVLRHEDFGAGTVDTGFIERNLEALVAGQVTGAELEPLLVGTALAMDVQASVELEPLFADFPSGWSNTGMFPQRWELRRGADLHKVATVWGRDGDPVVEIDGRSTNDVKVISASPDSLEMEFEGLRYTVSVRRYADRVHASAGEVSAVLDLVPRFPDADVSRAAGALSAEMPGTVVAVNVTVGARVEEGDRLAVIESMKMERAIVAPTGGLVEEIHASVGDQVDAGTVLVVLKED